MKKVKIIFFLLMVPLSFVCLISLYNHTICPFDGYNKDYIINPGSHNVYYVNEVDEFYNEYVNYNKYEEKYNTSFFYKHGKNSLFNYIGLIYWYSMESYSYTIFLGDDYDVVKNEILNQVYFIKTPVGYDDLNYVDNFEVNGSIYNEIYMKDEITDDKIYLEQLRVYSYWFSYNDSKKQISFSCIFHFEPIYRKDKHNFEKWLSYQF